MSTGSAWNPLSELLSVQKRMNDLFESALARSNFEAGQDVDRWTPVADGSLERIDGYPVPASVEQAIEELTPDRRPRACARRRGSRSSGTRR